MNFPKDFEIAIDLVLRHEGGYVNNPNDSGGETNYGITARSLATFNEKHAYAWTVPTLTKEKAKQFYLLEYWNPMRLSEIRDPAVKNVLLGCAVNMGIRPAVRKMQVLLGRKTDGMVGHDTINTLNLLSEANSFRLVGSYCGKIEMFYRALAERRPKDKIFLKGWLNRINSYRIA